MIKLSYILCGLYTLSVVAMDSKGSQLDLCTARKVYDQQQSQRPAGTCVFCDPAILALNYIIQEDHDADVRKMLNKNPYISSFDQGHHLLIMPIAHKGEPCDFSRKELDQQASAALDLSIKLYDGCHSQEYFTNWGKLSGQTVLSHWHSQLKVYMNQPRSLPEVIASQHNPKIATIEEAFSVIKARLNFFQAKPLVDDQLFCDKHYTCCCCIKEECMDEKNLIIMRFKHNFVCLSHYPQLPGEVCVVPYKHVPAIRYLSQEEWNENMAIAMALFPKMREYAQAHIRDCDGGNLYTKSLGNSMSIDEQRRHHVHTVIMPRTTIPFIPGFIDGNSCKLDYDPLHLFAYLKNLKDEIAKKSGA